MNVHLSGFKKDGLVYIDSDEAEKLDHVTVQPGDILLNITGASIGRVTTAPESLAGARVNQHVCIIRPKPEIFSPFLAYFLFPGGAGLIHERAGRSYAPSPDKGDDSQLGCSGSAY